MTTLAYPAGQIPDAAKMGALGAFSAALIAYGVARATGVTPSSSK